MKIWETGYFEGAWGLRGWTNNMVNHLQVLTLHKDVPNECNTENNTVLYSHEASIFGQTLYLCLGKSVTVLG